MNTTTTTIPKVCTWHTFFTRALYAGLVDTEAENFDWGVTLQWKVKAQAEAEGWDLYRWNSKGRCGNAVGTQVWTRKSSEFWVEFCRRGDIPLRFELF